MIFWLAAAIIKYIFKCILNLMRGNVENKAPLDGIVYLANV